MLMTAASRTASAQGLDALVRAVRDAAHADVVAMLLAEPSGRMSLLATCARQARRPTATAEIDATRELPAEVIGVAEEASRCGCPRTWHAGGGDIPSGAGLRHLVAVPLEAGSLRGALVAGLRRRASWRWLVARNRLIALAQPVSAVAELLRMREIEGAANTALRESEQLSRAAIDTAVDGILTIDERGVVQTLNPAAQRLFGWSSSELVGRNVATLMPAQYGQEHDEYLARYLRTGERRIIGIGREVTGLRRDGTTFPMDLAVSEVWLGARRLFTGVVRDISERRIFQARLAHQAMHDPLTGLANRALLIERIEHAISRFDRTRGHLAVLFLDLDRFKVVNDSMGHDAGDQLLMEAAARLRDVMRPADTVARLGGDEFVLLVEDVADTRAAAAVAARVVATLSEPFTLRGNAAYVSASVGVALGAPGDVAQDVLRDADAAMYAAKAAGRSRFEIFDGTIRAQAVGRLHLQTSLHRALEREEFEVLYQPEVDLTSGAVVAVEALLRWRHPERGQLAPGHFLDLADDAGLMPEIDSWVLHRACSDIALLSERLGRPLPVWVNVSSRMFSDPRLLDVVGAALAAADLSSGQLGLEITEGVLMQNAAVTLHVLDRLKSIGIRLIVDDFGTGYSSLAYLKHFPVDGLKVDRGFISGLPRDKGSLAIIQAVVTLARTMRIAAVAEGLETAEQLRTVSLLGCPYGQGFFLGRPADAASALIAAAAGVPLLASGAG